MEAFVTRQPIFSRDLQVYGYRLLFPQDLSQTPDAVAGNKRAPYLFYSRFAAAELEALGGGKPLLVKLTGEQVVDEAITTIPPEIIAIELITGYNPAPEVVQACRSLKQMGYRLVIDAAIGQRQSEKLAEMADVVKIDFPTRALNERIGLPKLLRRPQLAFLAENVASSMDLQVALVSGYEYIHGDFYKKSEGNAGQALAADTVRYLEILGALVRPQISFDALAQIVAQERDFPAWLLAYVNSGHFNLSNRVSTVRQAMTLLGTEEIRKWTALTVLRCLASARPPELVSLAAVRSKFCELVGARAGFESQRTVLALTGLLSLIDVVAAHPLSALLANLPLPLEIRDALLGGETILTPIYQLVLAYEAGDWTTVAPLASHLKLDPETVAKLYRQAIVWSNHVLSIDASQEGR